MINNIHHIRKMTTFLPEKFLKRHFNFNNGKNLQY